MKKITISAEKCWLIGIIGIIVGVGLAFGTLFLPPEKTMLITHTYAPLLAFIGGVIVGFSIIFVCVRRGREIILEGWGR